MENQPLLRRGSLSRIRDEARASLKNPSRPFTPRSAQRSLFQGNDYRSNSRPCSTESVGPQTADIWQAEEDWEAECISAPQKSDCKMVEDVEDDDADFEMLLMENQDAKAIGKEQNSYAHFLMSLEDTQDYTENTKRVCEDMMEHILAMEKNNAHESLDSGNGDDYVSSQLSFARGLKRLVQLKLSTKDVQYDFIIAILQISLKLYYSIPKASHAAIEEYVTWSFQSLFDITKESQNDALFCDAKLIETILCLFEHRSTKIDAAELEFCFPAKSIIYAAGCLKNISGNNQDIQMLMGRHGCIAALSTILQSKETSAQSFTQDASRCVNRTVFRAQLFVQITGTLRNLCTAKAHHKQFYNCNVIFHLCALLHEYQSGSHTELLLNATRILSKMTLHEAARRQVSENPKNLQYLLGLLDDKQTSVDPDVAIRTCFVLGNLCSSKEKNRLLVLNYGSTILVGALNAQTIILQSGDSTKVVDVLTKLLRLIANLTMCEDAGRLLSSNEQFIQNLFGLLDNLLASSDKSNLLIEECILNTQSCLANLSCYWGQENVVIDTILRTDSPAILSNLLDLFLQKNDEITIEALRFLSNLAKVRSVQSIILADPRLLEILSMLLDHSNYDVILIDCGVLINTCSCDEAKSLLLERFEVVSKLTEVFRSSGLQCLDVSILSLKTLTNLLSGKASYNFQENTYRTLVQTLDELQHAVADSDADEDVEFRSVASVLETLLESHEVATSELEAL